MELTNLALFRKAVYEFRNNRFISLRTALTNSLKHCGGYRILDGQDIKRVRSSDTLFILGSGPSLNLVGNKEQCVIQKHDTLGMGLSFLFDRIIPTYQIFSQEVNLGSDRGREHQTNLFQEYRHSYRSVITLIGKNALFRLVHPRLMPEVFPEHPSVHYLFNRPNGKYDHARGFDKLYFDQSLIYRGTLSVALEFAFKQEYKSIVLLGVDPSRWQYFYQDDPRTKGTLESTYRLAKGVPPNSNQYSQYVGMHRRPGNEGTILEYIQGLTNYLAEHHDVSLMTGFGNSDLCPHLPFFFE